MERLTDRRLERAPKGREVLSDRETPGLRARGGPRGWRFLWVASKTTLSPDGKPHRRTVVLGSWGSAGIGLSVKEARKRAALFNVEERIAPRASGTVAALAEDWLARRYPANAVRRQKVEALLECHALPIIGAMPVAAVKRETLVKLVQQTQKERRLTEVKGSPRRGGRAPAEALCRVLRQLFRDAVKTGKLESLAHSPAELLDPKDFGIPPARSRDRALSTEELATLLAHVDIDLSGLLEGCEYRGQISPSVRAAIILGPFLAVRPIAMLGMRWDELDLEKATWTVSGGRGAKLRHHLRPDAKPFVVPLSETPLAVLQILGKPPHGEFVLPATLKTGHISGDVYADAMHRLTRKGGRLQLPGGQVRPHDARRTFASAATCLGVERYVVERCLQHSLGKVSDTYLVDDSFERRRAAHVLVDEHWTAVRMGKSATVVRLVGGAA
jgi:integrase